jgi:hypothetical protein
VKKRDGERERDVEYDSFIFIFKRNDGCLGTFSYLVYIFISYIHRLHILYAPEVVFTTLHFLHILQIVPISQSVVLQESGTNCQGQTL